MTSTFASIGSTVSVPNLPRFMRHAAQEQQGIAQLAAPPDGSNLGKGKGDTVRYNWMPNLTTTGGELDENEAVPQGSGDPVQASYTFKEYGNSRKWTSKLEDLAALDMDSSFMQTLNDDRQKLENTECYNAAVATDWKLTFATATGNLTKNGTASGTTAVDLSWDTLRASRRLLKKNLVPLYDGESYVAAVDVDSEDSLIGDSDVTGKLQEDSGRAALNGEIGRIAGFRIVVDNHKLAKATGSIGEQLLFGADSLRMDVACPWEVIAESKDFGRQVAVAYLGIYAFFKSLSQSVHGQENIIHVTSA